MTVTNTRIRVSVTLGMMLASLFVVAPPALAACHIAGFVESEVEVGEGADSVVLTVELQGRQPSCEGTVDWATQDGSATAGSDYAAGSGTLTFVAEDDRVEDITIEILDGASAGDFEVVLSNPTGSISSTGGPATVTIAGSADPTEPATTEGTQPPDDPTEQVTDPTATDVPTDEVVPSGDDGGLPWVPILAVVIVLALLVGLYIARRTPPDAADDV